EASRLARCIAALGNADLENPASWDPLLTSAEQSRTAAAIAPLQGKPFLAMAIASKMQATDWGIHNWRALMPGLHREFPDHAAVFIGAREDRDAVESVASEWAGQSLNLAGALAPR